MATPQDDPKLGMESERASAEQMDEKRLQNIAYEYLCHLEEAKVWIESCIKEKLPQTTEFEEYLRNGVCLARLGHFFAPDVVREKKIYDIGLKRYETKGLHFRHTDNIHHWLKAMEKIGLPKAILPETMDVYDKKNMPRVVYCLHALSLFLHKLGLAPKIQDLYGKVNFTEEEISTMRGELEKYDVQMPAFSTIDGILANEMPVDEAELHAAIIAINEAIDKDDESELLVALQNPQSRLTDVNPTPINSYHEKLATGKHEKIQNQLNKSTNPDEKHDAYDEMLTGKEIQDCLHVVNCCFAYQSIREALDEQSMENLLKSLNNSCLELKNVLPKNVQFYSEELIKLAPCTKDNNNETAFTRDHVQEALDNANEIGDKLENRNYAIKMINLALESGTADDLLVTLQSSDSQLPPVNDFAAELYFEEFSNNRQEAGVDLEYDELFPGINVLNALALINLAVEAGDSEQTYDSMKNNDAYISGLDIDGKQRYQTVLYNAKRQKNKTAAACPLLTHLEIQECIFIVNKLVQEEHKRIAAIHEINNVLRLDNHEKTLEALSNTSMGITDIDAKNSLLYHYMLQNELQSKASSTDDTADETCLWIDEVQHAIDRANNLSTVALKYCKAIAAINKSLDEGLLDKFSENLQDPDAQLFSVTTACLKTYMNELSAIKANKLETGSVDSMWLEYTSKEGFSLHYDLKTEEANWGPFDITPEASVCVSRSEIQSVLTRVTSQYDRELLYKAMEPIIVQLQACIRGYLLRRGFKKRFEFLCTTSDSVVKIQSWWRGCRQRRAYLNRKEFLKNNIGRIIKVQSVARRNIAMKSYRSRLEYFRRNVSSIIKIQTCWRASKTRKAFQELTTSEKPSYLTVQMFVHLLDINNLDFSEELELHQLRGEVVKSIRHNQQLEKDLCTMDIKIGLLVKNRITLQDVVAHGKKMDKKSKEGSDPASSAGQHGLKSLSKDSRQKVEAYQHLFYLLQTEPRYLSHLIFLMLPSKTSKFIETVVQTLYNYASNQREEYLLLKLFKAALQEEIRCKVDEPGDVIMGNTLIIKMIVGFHRNKRGQGSLREILGPLVRNVLDNKNLHINTNPVEVYKAWVNQLETQSGKPSELPYNVTQEQALKHNEVWMLLNESVKNLKDTTLIFFNAILSSLDKLPYGILYMAKILKSSLEEKFPDAPQKEILKVVGNLLYYRYINSAIVAPDAFDIVDIGANESLTNEQRRNLGSVAKILQFATSKTGFGDDSPHLVSLNPFIIECHEKFKKFFYDACDVPELESHFKIFEYTEATMLTKPVIYISLQEIFEMHMLLLDHENSLAPNPDDPLHELLEDLGEKPNVEALIGENLGNVGTEQLAKTEVCLMLSNKFEIPENTKNDLNRLYVRTKQMIVDVMHCIEVGNIPDMISYKITDYENKKYISLLAKRQEQNEKAETDKKQRILRRNPSDCDRDTLEEVVDKIRHNLNVLELESCISSKNNYQDIINTIALDIRNRRRYRIRRKQDLLHLKTTLSNLQAKTSFFEAQVDYFNQYIKQCLDNMSTLRKKVRRHDSEKKVKTKMSLKYTAAKLREKGVILNMEGLSSRQFKNVLFEITPSEVAGLFGVTVRYMGTNLSDVELDIQSLLEMQYEGVSVTTMFERAEVNVNLLLHLLNSKFYGKSK